MYEPNINEFVNLFFQSLVSAGDENNVEAAFLGEIAFLLAKL